VVESSCQLLLLLGEAGVGKSRLIGDATARLCERASVFTGRCPSYGESISFWPLAEVVRQAGGISETDSPQQAAKKLADRISAEEQAPEISRGVSALIGLAAGSFTQQDLMWAARRYLEALAKERPLVLIFDDLHWAEPSFLQLLDHLAGAAQHVPILLLCTARPELLERQPDWSTDQANRSSLALERLTAGYSEALVGNLLGSAALDRRFVARINEAARGNALSLEQIVSMWLEDGSDRKSVV
jgi:predicted ATPase